MGKKTENDRIRGGGNVLTSLHIYLATGHPIHAL